MSSINLDQLYRQVIMDHYKTPRNRGEFDNDDTFTVHMNNPSCGDRIQLQMKIEDDKIIDAKFVGEGCSISLASASMMTQAVKGLSVEDALAMSEIFTDMLLGKEYDADRFDLGDIEALQGVSKFPARFKCAALVWMAMEKGMEQEENR